MYCILDHHEISGNSDTPKNIVLNFKELKKSVENATSENISKNRCDLTLLENSILQFVVRSASLVVLVLHSKDQRRKQLSNPGSDNKTKGEGRINSRAKQHQFQYTLS